MFNFSFFPTSRENQELFSWGINFFSYKIKLKTRSELFISLRYTRNFGAKRDLSTNTLYILHIYKQLTKYISKKASQQAGEDV